MISSESEKLRSKGLMEYISTAIVESNNYKAISVRFTQQQIEIIERISYQVYGKSNRSKFVRELCESHFFNVKSLRGYTKTEHTLFEKKVRELTDGINDLINWTGHLTTLTNHYYNCNKDVDEECEFCPKINEILNELTAIWRGLQAHNRSNTEESK